MIPCLPKNALLAILWPPHLLVQELRRRILVVSEKNPSVCAVCFSGRNDLGRWADRGWKIGSCTKMDLFRLRLFAIKAVTLAIPGSIIKMGIFGRKG